MGDVSVFQLFEILQKEYIVCELRIKIYPILKHKDYWRDVARMKKEKISDIAQRNSLPSIFDDRRIKQDFERRIYNETGLPNFYYPNKHKEEDQRYWDLRNYFLEGSEVKYYVEGRMKVGLVSSLDVENKKVDIKVEDKVLTLSIEDVARVL